MTAKELYEKVKEQYKAKNFDETLKLIYELKKLVPNLPTLGLFEARVYCKMENFVRENELLKKIFPYFNLRDRQEKTLAAETLHSLGTTYYRLAMPEEAIKNFCLAAQLAPDDIVACRALSGAIFSACYAENFSIDDFRVLYGKYKKHLDAIRPYAPPKKFYEHDKIRVGFLSAFFNNNVAMEWSWALLTELDKDLFVTYCYSKVKKPDVITDKLIEEVDVWRDISRLSESAAAEMIHNDEIDILVDLTVHTVSDILRVTMYRPAPVQISGIGYVTSTGFECFDYFLTDVYCAGNPAYFTEKLLRLPHSHFCYKPIKKFKPAATPPCLAKGFVTFGCFNRFGKITDSMLGAWQRIFAALPDARLILKTKIFNTEDGKNFVRDRLKRFGIDMERVEMRGVTVDYLRQYDDVDIALDTFPYTGGVTTCEALYMGVPVVSLYGERHGSRIGLSILTNVGLEGLAVNSYDAYVERAIALAKDKELLSLLRKNLRGMMEKSPLMDSKIYIRDVEDAFIKILLDKRKEYA